MNEMELLTRFRDEVPPNVGTSRAESALMAAIRTGAPRPRAVSRAWRPMMAVGLAAAVAAGFLTVQAVTPGGTPPAAALTVARLSRLTAATAEAQPSTRARQWVYWKKEFRDASFLPGGRTNGVVGIWSTANASRVAYRHGGTLRFDRCSAFELTGACNFIGGQAYAVTASAGFYPWKTHPVTYRQLGSLPGDPRALDRYLGRLGYGPGGAATRAFTLIDFLLTTYVMPPRLTAELYLALGEIPGVTIDNHAVDVAGRHGVGFEISSGSVRYEIIIDPFTFRLMGDESAYRSGGIIGGAAILREVPVHGPGVLP